ncbi:MAG: oligosaccharide flippase family protein, partial [Clostridia bacterium]
MTNTTIKKRKFCWSSGVCFFVATSIVAKIVGAIYRIPLTNIIGIDGIAQYQLVFPFFSLLIAIICGGAPTTISRLVAYQSCKQLGLDDCDNLNANAVAVNNNDLISTAVNSSKRSTAVARPSCRANSNLLVTAFFYISIFSLLGSVICVLLARPLSQLQGNNNIAVCYMAIAPCVFFVGIASVLKGYFLGKGNMSPSSISNLVEQIVKLTLGLVFAKVFMRYGKIYSVAGALVAITLAEIVELIILIVMYAISRPTRPDNLKACLSANSKLLFSNLAPITLSGLIFPIVAFVDSLVIISLILLKTPDTALATSQYGLLSGPVNSLINMPVVLSLALSMAIVPT